MLTDTNNSNQTFGLEVRRRRPSFWRVVRASDDGGRAQAESRGSGGESKVNIEVRVLSKFHAYPAYAGDLHRADMASAKICGRLWHDARTDQGTNCSRAATSARRAAASSIHANYPNSI